MIELPRPPFDFAQPSIKVFGLGGAGCNALDRVVLDGVTGAALVAINTDAQALTASIAEAKVQIGQTITRGLGAGGDPEVGRTAAEEGIGEILGALADATIVFLLVGLGGGTGSGAAPVVAEITREHNAMVVVVATLPFQFEGRRRRAQAMEALAALQHSADILICFENDRMGESVSPKASIQEAFAVADATIGQAVRALIRMATRRAPVHAGFDEIASTFRGETVRALFGYGEAGGDNRAHEALDAALKNPLLDRGRRLRDAESAVVQIAGGPDLTLNEVQILMEEVHRYLPEQTRLYFGAAVDPGLAGRLGVTILGGVPLEFHAEAQAPRPVQRPARSTPVARIASPASSHRSHPEMELDLGETHSEEPEPAEAEEETAELEPIYETPAVEPEPEAEPEPVAEKAPLLPPVPDETPAPVAVPTAPARRPIFAPFRRPAAAAPAPAPVAAREERAEQMQLEPINRGRFEKSEPTMSGNENLDIPTFLRRSSRVK